MAMGPAQLTRGVASDGGSRGTGNTMRATATSQGRWRMVPAALAAGLFLAACGSSTSSSPTSTTTSAASAATSAAAAPTASPTSAVCQAAAELRTSVDTLTHITIGKGTADEVKSDLANVEAKLKALTTEMHGEFKSQTDAVTAAIDTLKKAVSNLTAHFSTSNVKAAATALGGVATATSSLLASLAPQCGSASASPSP